MYTTVEQVSHFVDLRSMPDFSGLEGILEEHLPKLEKDFDLADYGPGNGVKTAYLAHLLQELRPTTEEREVHLIDYNEFVLQVAEKVIRKLTDGLPVSISSADPIDLGDHHSTRKRKDRSRLHFLLGQTIGNFKDPLPVAAKLNRSMKKGEYLVVEGFDRNPED
mgnify:CR=1 FL=1